MLNASRKWLDKLLKNGSMAASSIPRPARAEIVNVENSGFIRWEKSGAGARYYVANKSAIHDLLSATGFHGDLSRLTSKAKAVALHGDAHKGKDEAMLLTLSTAGRAFWSNGEVTLDVANNVSNFGVASLVVRPGDNWLTNQPVGLVENLDLVLHGEEYFTRVGFQGSLLYYSGWLSRALIAWLTETIRAPSYVVFADYDLVGIKNYLLAKRRLGETVSIYVPDNLPELLRRFGHPGKLESKSDRKLIEQSGDPEAISIYQELLVAGCGLDQESLLLM